MWELNTYIRIMLWIVYYTTLLLKMKYNMYNFHTKSHPLCMENRFYHIKTDISSATGKIVDVSGKYVYAKWTVWRGIQIYTDL